MVNLYRRRLIPEECVHLKDDHIIMQEDNMLLTHWETLRPKAQFAYGYSLYVIDKGWKISKFYDYNHNFVYWYCDIIETRYNADDNSYIFTDLLADVIINSAGEVKVVDLDEFEPAYQNGLISTEEILTALNRLNGLLEIIYSGQFSECTKLIEKFDKNIQKKNL